MEFKILGPLEVVEGARAVDLPGTKHRALLAMLLLHANEVVSTERLIEALWEDERPHAPQKTLQVYVSQLRKSLGRDRVETRAPGYLVRVRDDELDVARFQRLVDHGRLTEALLLWRGPPLAEFSSERFAQGEIARLEEQHLACVERRIEQDLGAGRHAEVVGELGLLVQDHPLREQLRAQLMLALYRSGRQAEALEVYRDARRAFVEELGIEPGRVLRELEMAILEQDPSLDVVGSADGKARETAAASRSALVGRGAETSALLAGLEAAVAGRGRLMLVSGEPGIGKSRLADELMREAGARGARVLTGRCWEAGGAPAYWPWVQSLRAFVRVVPPERLRSQLGAGAVDLAQILPELRDIFAGLPEPPSRDSEAAQFRLFDATVEFLRNAAASQPIVLFLDDLHAADPPSLLLLRFLARELGSTRVLVLGAFRDVDPVPGQTLTATLVDVAREPGTRRLSLSGLSEAEVMEYVERTAPTIASPELGAALHRETEGNPLFVGETVRLLAVEGVPTDSAGSLRLAIPQNVREVIARRLTHLSAECNRILLLASVVGREFEHDALARIGAVPMDGLLDLLDEAMVARVVSDVPGARGRFRFSHVLIRETVYDGVSVAHRVRLHRLVAETLEDVYGESLEGHHEETSEHVLTLARHWFEAGEPTRAIAYYRRGAELAMLVFANYEAAEALTRAVEVLRQTPASSRRDEEELELTMMLGAVRGWGSPDYARARDLCVKLGRTVDPPILRGMALNSILRLELADARDAGIALLAAAEHDEDPVLTVEGEYVLGVTSFWEGDFGDARRHLERALERYSPWHRETHITLYSQDPKVVCLSRLAWALWFLGDRDEAARARDSALTLAGELGHPFSRCYAGLYGVIVSQEMDDEPTRARLLGAVETLADEERFEVFATWAAVLRHWSLARRGDRNALDAMRTAIADIEETRGAPLVPYFLALLARGYLVAGQPGPGLATVTSALRDTQRTGARYMDSELQRIRGELLATSGGDAADIEKAFGRAHEIACRQEARALELRAAGALERRPPALH